MPMADPSVEAFSLMKSAKLALLVVIFLLAGCNSTSKLTTTTTTTTQNSVRAYNGTAAVGDFLTISIDSNTNTIAYHSYTNGQTGTVPYTVNADGGYTITDPQGNLLSAYEVPGSVMVVEAANAGPLHDSAALITAVESVPASVNTFAGQNFNYIQFRTRDGGVEIGNVTIDPEGNLTARSYDPGESGGRCRTISMADLLPPPVRKRTLRGTSSPSSNRTDRRARFLGLRVVCGRR